MINALVHDAHSLCMQSHLSGDKTLPHICIDRDNFYLARVLFKEIKLRGGRFAVEINFLNFIEEGGCDILSLAIKKASLDWVKLVITNLFVSELVEDCYLNALRKVPDTAPEKTAIIGHFIGCFDGLLPLFFSQPFVRALRKILNDTQMRLQLVATHNCSSDGGEDEVEVMGQPQANSGRMS